MWNFTATSHTCFYGMTKGLCLHLHTKHTYYCTNYRINILYFYGYSVLYFRHTHINKRKLVTIWKSLELMEEILATIRPTAPLKHTVYLKIKHVTKAPGNKLTKWTTCNMHNIRIQNHEVSNSLLTSISKSSIQATDN